VVTPLGTQLSTEVLVAFIDSVKERFGVEPVCHVHTAARCCQTRWTRCPPDASAPSTAETGAGTRCRRGVGPCRAWWQGCSCCTPPGVARWPSPWTPSPQPRSPH